MSSTKKINASFSFRNNAVLIKSGHEYFDTLKKLIREAKDAIQIQVYIFEDDHTGNEIGHCLIAAAKKNVKVQVLLDGYASRNLSKEFIQQIRKAGIQLRFFEPIWKSKYYYFGRRFHCKIVVIDGKKALVGGINISDRYNDMPGMPAWLDYAVLIEGETAFELHKLCLQFFFKRKKIETWVDKQLTLPTHVGAMNTAMRIRRNDWVMNKNQISGTYMEMLRNAENEIIMMSSYLIPNKFFRKQISAALKRGVHIKFILAAKSDVYLAKNAERYFYRWALRNQIQIFEYLPSVLHSKLAICDNKMATIGSYNINDISAFASMELNIDVIDTLFVQSVRKTIDKIIALECVEINKENMKNNYSLLDRLTLWISYVVFRFVFKLFTFYFTKKNDSSIDFEGQ